MATFNSPSRPPRPVQQVMVSSTYKDLNKHRLALIEALHKHKLYANVMEHDDARIGQDLIDASMEKVVDSAGYILLIGCNYGQIPVDRRNPEELSVTELEFIDAQERGRPTLVFIMGEEHPVPIGAIERSPERLDKLNRFRERAKAARIYSKFESLEEFKSKIAASLTELCQHLAVSQGKCINVPVGPWKVGMESGASPNLPIEGRLRSGRTWSLVESSTKAISPDRGRHLILQVPHYIDSPDGNPYHRDELKPEEMAELWLVAEVHAKDFSKWDGRPSYYRIECNGPAAANNPHLHFHIITGRRGIVFRRCVDSIERSNTASVPVNDLSPEQQKNFYTAALEKIIKCQEEGSRRLDLRHANLTQLPPEIGNLSHLKTLDLSNNLLESLPATIGNLQQLTRLSVENNRLHSLPPQIGALSNLTTLLLRQNQLRGLPPEIGNLRELEKIRLANNELTSLPPEIGNLAELSWLGIPFNRLRSLLPEIGLLKNLTMLRAFNNNLTRLPDEIGELDELEEVYLSDNQLEDLPEVLQQLAQLRVLSLHGNDKLGLPYIDPESTDEDGIDVRPDEVLAFYFNLRRSSGNSKDATPKIWRRVYPGV